MSKHTRSTKVDHTAIERRKKFIIDFSDDKVRIFLEVNKVKPWSRGWLIAAGAYPGFCSIKRLEVFLLPLDGMLVHRRSLPRNFVRFPQQIAGTHLYTWVERGTVRVKCLAQEHNTLSPARARTRTARSGVERTNHDATAPPTRIFFMCKQNIAPFIGFTVNKKDLYSRKKNIINCCSGVPC